MIQFINKLALCSAKFIQPGNKQAIHSPLRSLCQLGLVSKFIPYTYHFFSPSLIHSSTIPLSRSLHLSPNTTFHHLTFLTFPHLYCVVLYPHITWPKIPARCFTLNISCNPSPPTSWLSPATRPPRLLQISSCPPPPGPLMPRSAASPERTPSSCPQMPARNGSCSPMCYGRWWRRRSSRDALLCGGCSS